MNSSRTRSPLKRARALWDVRRILWLLVKRDLKVRYAGSYLGYVWTVLDPLLMSLIYFTMFSLLFDRNVGEEPYIVFLLAGMLPWQWFTSTVNGGSKALKASRKLIGSTDLPREIWVLRVVIANGIEFVFSLPVLAAFLIILQVPVNWVILTIPLAIVIQAVLLFGITLFLAPLVVLVPDLERLIKLVLRLFFYSSPILYSPTRLPPDLQWVYVANPLSDLLQFYRSGIFADLLNWWHVGIAAGASVVILLIGWLVFVRLEQTVLKEL